MTATAPAAQAAVLTVTLNPALDLSSATDRVRPDVKLRCEAPIIHPGGGGLNVSRAIALMGGHSRALAAIGGLSGQRVVQLLAEAGIGVIALTAPGETRESFTVTDNGTGEQFRFVLPGPAWDQSLVAQALDQIVLHAPVQGYVVLSGSNPPGVPAEFGAMLAERLDGPKLIVDTSGEALARIATGTGKPIEILRMDDKEAEWLAGQALAGRSDTAAFAASLVGKGVAKGVIIARGRDGNIIATRDGIWHAHAEAVPVVSRVGAGDSYLAGFTLAIARGWSIPDALGLGAAAASATVQTPATELCRPADVDALYDVRVVTRM